MNKDLKEITIEEIQKKEYLNTKETAVYLSRTVSSINNLTLRGQLPFRRIGKRGKIFIRKEIDEVIASRSDGVRVKECLEAYK